MPAPVDQAEHDADRFELELLRGGARRFALVGAPLVLLGIFWLAEGRIGGLPLFMLAGGLALLVKAKRQRVAARRLGQRIASRTVEDKRGGYRTAGPT
jgi:hypothetical protein